MNTDDRALANLIAELRGLLAKATEPGPPEGLVDSDSAERPMCSTNAMVWRDYYDRRNKAANALVSELPTLLDRLEAFHAKPVVGRWPDRESIADAFLLSPHRVQNGDRQHANPADYIEYIRTYKSASLGEARRVADFVLSLPGALAALQSPPPVVSLPLMSAAFRTTSSGSGEYCMHFKFPTMGALHAADDEWIKFRKGGQCTDGAGETLVDALKHCKALILSTGREIPVTDGKVALPADLSDVERSELRGVSTPPVVEEGRREAASEFVPITDELVTYISRYGGRCRDCADRNGFCALTGIGCGESDKAIRWVLGALNYGVAHGFLALTPVEGAGNVIRHLETLADNNPDKPADWLSGVMDAISSIRALSTPATVQGDEVREALEIIFREWDARTDPSAEMPGWPDDPAAVMNDAWKNGFYDKAKAALATLGAPHEG